MLNVLLSQQCRPRTDSTSTAIDMAEPNLRYISNLKGVAEPNSKQHLMRLILPVIASWGPWHSLLWSQNVRKIRFRPQFEGSSAFKPTKITFVGTNTNSHQAPSCPLFILFPFGTFQFKQLNSGHLGCCSMLSTARSCHQQSRSAIST